VSNILQQNNHIHPCIVSRLLLVLCGYCFGTESIELNLMNAESEQVDEHSLIINAHVMYVTNVLHGEGKMATGVVELCT